MITYPQLYALFAIVAAVLLLAAVSSIASSRRSNRQSDNGQHGAALITESRWLLLIVAIGAFLWRLAEAYPFGQ